VAHKIRSALTILGILFGVWSVIAMLAINEGATYESQQALRELGSDNIIIESVKPEDEDSKASQSRGTLNYGLTRLDVKRLRGNLPGIVDSAVVHRTAKQAHAGTKNMMASVIATEPAYARVAKINLAAGRFLTDADSLRQKRHCVLTQSFARKLFGFEDPLRRLVAVGNEPFRVVGILRYLPRTLAGGPGKAGNFVIIPLETDRKRFGEYTVVMRRGSFSSERVEVSQFILNMTGERAVLQGARIARKLLADKHDRQDYLVTVPLELIEQRRKQLRLWNFMFFAIASVSLLVGGIGIMNIMLASVTERTREIGIRRALGAKRRDITVQFLVEAVTLTTVGGLLGIAIGLAVPWAVRRVLGFTTIVTAPTLVLPFVMAVVVGLLSGLYPALRAARLDPIVALRHE
jgi:putative ABC transport system permease protein